MSSNYHLSEVLQRFLPSYQQLHPLSYRQSSVCEHIQDCHTAKLGMQQWRCDKCEFQKLKYCSCRDRHCPRCQGQKSQEWIAKQQARVINGPYFHVVFTLPHELNVMSQYADKALYRALFQAVWQTLSQFAANRKQLKGQLGITTVLHTWGQTLSQHIHLHCLVPGGVLTKEGKWVGVKKAYLFPVKALSKVFKGKMLQALREQNVALPHLDKAINKPWCVYSKACLSRPETVIKYLARYTQKGMLHESRIKHIDKDNVTFSYKDYRAPTQQKTMTVSGIEFIRRYLTHVLPKGFMRVRHFGFLANRCRAKKLKLIHQQTTPPSPSSIQKPEQAVPICWPCPICKLGILRLAVLTLPSKVGWKMVEVNQSG